ncbi:hypothetical protein [Lentzea flaviverrucosa]|uniref:Tetratricopeptide repeat-containing protein n=1 Tax=Lentzea flaviverrucosa TaxID=200379 RepID=A0A1H9XNQ2_9PSEU|nr:hypothetical protein [Lentzea flaviverrucosa]RDI19675.1 hypothetical protein DFR72_11629 [Lentzea flaviverrucosa]SES47795.1 hypothetical protein SAMN05216195_11629 [Lentzea flaviverrucosa]
MAHSNPEVRQAQSRYATRTRELGPNHPETQAAQAEFRSERYMAAVRAAVADAPPLTSEQRARIAAILAPVTVASGTEEAA